MIHYPLFAVLFDESQIVSKQTFIRKLHPPKYTVYTQLVYFLFSLFKPFMHMDIYAHTHTHTHYWICLLKIVLGALCSLSKIDYYITLHYTMIVVFESVANDWHIGSIMQHSFTLHALYYLPGQMSVWEKWKSKTCVSNVSKIDIISNSSREIVYLKRKSTLFGIYIRITLCARAYMCNAHWLNKWYWHWSDIIFEMIVNIEEIFRTLYTISIKAYESKRRVFLVKMLRWQLIRFDCVDEIQNAGDSLWQTNHRLWNYYKHCDKHQPSRKMCTFAAKFRFDFRNFWLFNEVLK